MHLTFSLIWWSQKSRQFSGKNKIELSHTRKAVLLPTIHLGRCLIVQCLMQTFLIVKGEVRSQVAHGVCNTLVIFEIHLLLFHTAPQALHKNSVPRSPSAIPTDANSGGFESVRKLGTGKLHALVTVEDLGRGHPQGSIQCLQAKTGIQRDRYLPGEHIAAVPIHYRHQIDEASRQADVGDVTTPDLIAPFDAHSSEQVRILLFR
jgi:hypothetical protein